MPEGNQPSASSSGTPSQLRASPSAATPTLPRAVEDIELDDGLDDNELSEGETTIDNGSSMGSIYRNGDNNSSSAGGAKKMSEVANAISSCLALSFFSISMILANKVRTRLTAVGLMDCGLVGLRMLLLL